MIDVHNLEKLYDVTVDCDTSEFVFTEEDTNGNVLRRVPVDEVKQHRDLAKQALTRCGVHSELWIQYARHHVFTA